MLELKRQGLYCEAGDFFIDPSGKVENAVLTHAHSDHARRGARNYFSTASGLSLVKARLGGKIQIHGFAFGEKFQMGPVRVSFHPAGHILGSGQVRLEWRNEVWVVSGDYKRDPDPTCEPFESVPCDVFVTEATFGTPAFRWNKGADLGVEIALWWQENRAQGKNSVLCAYSLGKTQRLLGLLKPHAEEAIFLDPNAVELTDCYRREGIALADTVNLAALPPGEPLKGAMVIGPPSLLKSPLAVLLGEKFCTAFASGWTARGNFGWGGEFDRGFLLSDHADWDDLLRTVEESKAKKVYVQHRGDGALVRYLRKIGIAAFPDSALAQAEGPKQLSLF